MNEAGRPQPLNSPNPVGEAVRAERAGQVRRAELLYRQLLAREPRDATALQLLGQLCFRTGRGAEAIHLLQRSVAAAPDRVEFRNGYAAVLGSLGDLRRSTAVLRDAIRLAPDHAESHNNLGVNLERQGLLAEAVEAFGRAWGLAPSSVAFGTRHADALRRGGCLDEAEDAFARVIAGTPDHAEAHAGLADLYLTTARHREAIASYMEAIALRPGDAALHSAMLYAIHYCPGIDAETVAREHRDWAARHETPVAADTEPHDNDNDPNRRLRVGYLSPDLRAHSVATFFEPLLDHQDRRSYEVTCYYSGRRPDAVTERLRGKADRWREVGSLADARVASMIREDRIDILVDLTGHMAGNRALVFARRPAPVQVNYVGHPDTTGMRGMGYRLTNAVLDPPTAGNEHLYTERLVRLPSSFGCYRPPDDDCSPLVPPPCLANGYVTFGCLNNPTKLSVPFIDACCRVLRAVPGSRLLVLTAGQSSHLHGLFAARGLDPSAGRVEFLRQMDRAAYFDAFNRIDVALDPFPYNGQTTSCDGFWMGVPLVTLAGETYASRMGAALLSHLGMTGLIADDTEAFVNLAAGLAENHDRLVALRSTLRSRLLASPLCDGAALARGVESAFRAFWIAWCTSTTPTGGSPGAPEEGAGA